VKRVAFALLVACSKPAPPPGAIVNTPALDDFRSVEKTTLQTFSDALGRQRANTIDELGLAEAIDHDVLPPWRDLRARISGATIPDADRAVFATLVLTTRPRSRTTRSITSRTPPRPPTRSSSAKHFARSVGHQPLEVLEVDREGR
jgi:hypothetical protein